MLKLVAPVVGALDECEFFLRFPEVEDIRGRARVIAQWSERGSSFAEFEIVDVSKAGRQAFQRAIAVHCVWTGTTRSTGRRTLQQVSRSGTAQELAAATKVELDPSERGQKWSAPAA